MSTALRFGIYATVIGMYILFGLLKGWESIFPWGAVMLGVPIIIAELGTQYSIWKRNK